MGCGIYIFYAILTLPLWGDQGDISRLKQRRLGEMLSFLRTCSVVKEFGPMESWRRLPDSFEQHSVVRTGNLVGGVGTHITIRPKIFWRKH